MLFRENNLAASAYFGLKDHGVLTFKVMHTTVLVPTKETTRWILNKVHFPGIRSFQTHSVWPVLLCIDQYYAGIQGILIEAMHLFVPRPSVGALKP